MSDKPFEKGRAIRRGELDDDLPEFDEITGWFQRVPMTWLPGLFHALCAQCILRGVFQPGGMQSRLAYVEKIIAEGPEGVLREAKRESPEVDDSMVAMFDDGFTCGLVQMREMLARFVEQGGNPEIAQSIRLNWKPSWGHDPGPPPEIDEELVGKKMVEHAMKLINERKSQ